MRIGHMLDAMESIHRWIGDRDWESFSADDQLQAAVTYQIQIIGEAASRLSDVFRDAHPSIPWTVIIRMRHILVHHYMRVDARIVWRVVNDELTPLTSQLQSIASE